MPTAPPRHKATSIGKRHGIKPQTNRQATRGLHTGSKAWRALRRRVLARDLYQCRVCGKYGNEVDHINGDSQDNREDNLQTLCRPCHSTKTAGETGRAVVMLPKFKKKPLIPVTVIAGPPGSGKSTYARQQASSDDLIVDLDEIKARIGDDLTDAIAERNSMLYSLTRPSKWKRCWFVVMAPRRTERQHWREYLDADVVVLDVSADECLRRIENDPARTGQSREHWEHIVKQWWQRYVPDIDEDRAEARRTADGAG